MLSRWWKYGLWAMVVVAIFTAAHVAFWQRIMVEKDFRQVQLVVNYEEIASLAGYKGLTAREGIKEFSQHGVSGVVLREAMIDDLRLNGDIHVFSGQELEYQLQDGADLGFNIVGSNTYIITSNRDTYNQLASHMKVKLAGVNTYELSDTYVIETVAPYIGIKELGVGFTTASLADVQESGMTIIPQIRTWPGATQQSIIQAFALYRDIPNVSAVMFNDDTLPGFSELLPVLAYELSKMDVPITQVEFFPQRA
ncbi:hypothetical protein N752_00245 [Desulforamulus aquiferis]|nr:hypothetical protein N752_00245 [Desulforamulus aquiferis]